MRELERGSGSGSGSGDASAPVSENEALVAENSRLKAALERSEAEVRCGLPDILEPQD